MPVETHNDFELLREFVHDLKTPLGAAMSFVDLIEQSGELNDQQRHFSHRAHNALDRLMGAINDLLEFARMESDQNLKIELVDLKDTVRETWSLLESTAAENHILFTIDIAPTAQIVHADRALLRRILENLLSNAVKYNRISGEIEVVAQDRGDQVQVDVRDTGLGIPKDVQTSVFDEFVRVERSGQKKVHGTGLGLAIVKRGVERLGGDVWLKSQEGKGSTFSFTLLRANLSSPDDGRETPDDLDDDQQDGREALNDSDTGDQH